MVSLVSAAAMARLHAYKPTVQLGTRLIGGGIIETNYLKPWMWRLVRSFSSIATGLSANLWSGLLHYGVSGPVTACAKV